MGEKAHIHWIYVKTNRITNFLSVKGEYWVIWESFFDEFSEIESENVGIQREKSDEKSRMSLEIRIFHTDLRIFRSIYG